ncbi:hypothetical protein VNO78_05588 [Psophocarpus tetragonolobus]|uniref:Uncharacterized protein n=1 Tax=Psophocarpus tetragonolobus TaxID=3891 RepID=A0AAN9XR01_PSOTE
MDLMRRSHFAPLVYSSIWRSSNLVLMHSKKAESKIDVLSGIHSPLSEIIYLNLLESDILKLDCSDSNLIGLKLIESHSTFHLNSGLRVGYWLSPCPGHSNCAFVQALLPKTGRSCHCQVAVIEEYFTKFSGWAMGKIKSYETFGRRKECMSFQTFQITS